MSKSSFKFLAPLPLAVLLFGVPAVAQFEVSPDHFDEETRPSAQHPNIKLQGKAAWSKRISAATGSSGQMGKPGGIPVASPSSAAPRLRTSAPVPATTRTRSHALLSRRLKQVQADKTVAKKKMAQELPYRGPIVGHHAYDGATP